MGYNFRDWNDLSEKDKGFFIGDDYLPLSDDVAERISIIKHQEARDFKKEALLNVPGFSSSTVLSYKSEEWVSLENAWGNKDETQKIREWLHNRGIPYRTTVYLLYDNSVVVKTDWKTLVKFWDAFSWSVGMAMLVVDLSKRWLCEFHHENVLTFYGHEK